MGSCASADLQASSRTGFTPSYSPLFGDHETIDALIVTAVETTARIRADILRVNSERRLAQLFEQATTFMALLEGPEHRIVLANPGYRRVVGHREVVGKTITEALPEAGPQGDVRLLDQVGAPDAASGPPYRIEVEGQPPTDYIVDFAHPPIRDAEGQAHRRSRQQSERSGRVTGRCGADR